MYHWCTHIYYLILNGERFGVLVLFFTNIWIFKEFEWTHFSLNIAFNSTLPPLVLQVLWVWVAPSFTLLPFSHQIFEEGRDLSGEHSQVKEASWDFVVVLGQVAIPQVLQHLNILLFAVHMGWKTKNAHTGTLTVKRDSNFEFSESLKEGSLTCCGAVRLF